MIFDETDFAMGLVATARVVTRADYYGKASLIQPGNREWGHKSTLCRGELEPGVATFSPKSRSQV
jgi:hypothetical protein